MVAPFRASKASGLATKCPLSAVSTQPVSPSKRTEREPALVAENELGPVRIAGVQLAVFRLVFHGGGVVGIVGPLAEVHAMRTPFQASPARGPPPLFQI